MKICINKMPFSCSDCPCQSELYFCNLLRREGIGSEKRENDCPLQFLDDYKSQVVDKFIDEFILEYTMGDKPIEDILNDVKIRLKEKENEKKVNK